MEVALNGVQVSHYVDPDEGVMEAPFHQILFQILLSSLTVRVRVRVRVRTLLPVFNIFRTLAPYHTHTHTSPW